MFNVPTDVFPVGAPSCFQIRIEDERGEPAAEGTTDPVVVRYHADFGGGGCDLFGTDPDGWANGLSAEIAEGNGTCGFPGTTGQPVAGGEQRWRPLSGTLSQAEVDGETYWSLRASVMIQWYVAPEGAEDCGTYSQYLRASLNHDGTANPDMDARIAASALVTADGATGLSFVGSVFSPGRRASLREVIFGPATSAEGTTCLQRVDRPDEAACTGSFLVTNDATEPRFWTGWAVDGGGGHAGAAVYRVSRPAAPVGAEVIAFGAGLGDAGTLRIGDYAVPASDIASWTDTEVVFTMPAGAPTRPSVLTVDGGLGADEIVAPRIYATAEATTSLRAPLRVTAPYGSVLIEVTGSTAPDDLTLEFVDFYDPGGDALPPNPYTVRRVPEGFVVEIADPQPPGEVAVRISDGVERRTVFLDIDGSIQPFDGEWVTRHQGLTPLLYTLGFPTIRDIGGHLVIPTSSGAFLVHDDGTVQEIDGTDFVSGSWTRGIGEPHALFDDGAIRRVTSWNTTSMLARRSSRSSPGSTPAT